MELNSKCPIILFVFVFNLGLTALWIQYYGQFHFDSLRIVASRTSSYFFVDGSEGNVSLREFVPLQRYDVDSNHVKM